MKKIMLALVIAPIVSSLSYATPPKKEKARITLKIATLAPRGTEIMTILEHFRAEVLDKTNNEVDFKIYYGGVQGDDADVLRKIRIKQLHGGLFTDFGLGRITPEVRVVGIPFIFRNSDEVSYVRSKLADTLDKYFEDKGYVVIGRHDIGFVYMFSKKPISSIEILRKQKCWVWRDDPMMTAAYKALGVTPVPLSITDVMTSLSTRIVDSAVITPFGAVAFRWHTKFDYVTDIPGGNAMGALVVIKKVWDRISHESQKKIKKIAKANFDRLTKASIEADTKCVGILKDAGIKIVRFDEPQMVIEEMGEKARESVVGKLYSRELLDQTLALLDEYRRSHPDSTYTRIE